MPKWKYSAFYGTKPDFILRNSPFLGRNTIIVTGMATNFCCICTSININAFNRDYRVLFIDDLNCTSLRIIAPRQPPCTGLRWRP